MHSSQLNLLALTIPLLLVLNLFWFISSQSIFLLALFLVRVCVQIDEQSENWHLTNTHLNGLETDVFFIFLLLSIQ